jgi:hypothetical protein
MRAPNGWARWLAGELCDTTWRLGAPVTQVPERSGVRRSMHKAMGFGAALFGVLLGTAPASAQAGARSDLQDNYSYEFEDEQLLGEGLGTLPTLVGLGVKAARTPLMRPRTQFVTEMLKSIEHL